MLKQLLTRLYTKRQPQPNPVTSYASSIAFLLRLSTPARELFAGMLLRYEAAKKSDDIILRGDYNDFGLKHKIYLTRGKKELLKYRIIYEIDGGYLINPNYVDFYVHSSQKRWIKVVAEIKYKEYLGGEWKAYKSKE